MSIDKTTVGELMAGRKSAVFATMSLPSTGETWTVFFTPDNSTRNLNLTLKDGDGTSSRFRFQITNNDRITNVLERMETYWNEDRPEGDKITIALSGRGAAPKAAPRPTPTENAQDSEDRIRLARLRDISYKTANQEYEIARLTKRLSATMDKWAVGYGVGVYVSRNQINRGFRIAELYPEKKSATAIQVADTGLTNSGGNFDSIGPQYVHIADLVRDKKYDRIASFTPDLALLKLRAKALKLQLDLLTL